MSYITDVQYQLKAACRAALETLRKPTGTPYEEKGKDERLADRIQGILAGRLTSAMLALNRELQTLDHYEKMKGRRYIVYDETTGDPRPANDDETIKLLLFFGEIAGGKPPYDRAAIEAEWKKQDTPIGAKLYGDYLKSLSLLERVARTESKR